MYELTMNGTVVQLNFGMGFLREINKSTTIPVEGMQGIKKNVGLRYSVMRILNGDTEALAEVIDTANRGCEPRLTKGEIDKFIDSEDTDIDEVFEKVLGFLKTANATRKETTDVELALEKEKKKQEAMEKMRMEAMM